MPDHLHVVLAPKRPYTVSRCMHAIKGYSSYKINRATDRRGQLWQENFFDYALDSDEKVRTRVNYIHENPVRAGLVSEAAAYPFSSAHPENPSDVTLFLCPDGGASRPRLSAKESHPNR